MGNDENVPRVLSDLVVPPSGSLEATGSPWGRQSPSRPGEPVEIDSTPMDLMVVYPDVSSGRVDLTVALDIATRTPLAAILRPVATKAVDAAVLLAPATYGTDRLDEKESARFLSSNLSVPTSRLTTTLRTDTQTKPVLAGQRNSSGT